MFQHTAFHTRATRVLRRFAAVLLLAGAASGARAELGPAEICRAIHADIAEYLATDHPCPCPYNVTRRGTPCGRLSAWAKPAGKTPRCYAGDVTGEMAPNRRGEAVRTAFPPPPSCP